MYCYEKNNINNIIFELHNYKDNDIDYELFLNMLNFILYNRLNNVLITRIVNIIENINEVYKCIRYESDEINLNLKNSVKIL